MQFVVIAKDGKDDQALQRRLAAREKHLANMKRLKTNGNYIIGGPILNDKYGMMGSIVIVYFSSRDELDLWLNDDPYKKGNVWQEIEVHPFGSAALPQEGQGNLS